MRSFFVQKTDVTSPLENLFCPNNAPETYIFNSWRHRKLLVTNQLQDSTFLYEVDSEDIGISKLEVSQLKLLPSLFEIKDNGTVDRSTLLKKYQICHEIDASW